MTPRRRSILCQSTPNSLPARQDPVMAHAVLSTLSTQGINEHHSTVDIHIEGLQGHVIANTIISE